MPLYAFRCPDGHEYDTYERVADAPETAVCPVCGKEGRRDWSASFSFHGFEYTNFVQEYEAHRDKYPRAEDNIKYCELKLQESADDFFNSREEYVKDKKANRKVKVSGHGPLGS